MRSAIDGICAACLHAYRFNAAMRYVVSGSWILAAVFGGLSYAAFAQCEPCVRLQGDTAPAALALLIAGASGISASFLMARMYVRRCVRAGRAGRLLEAVADDDIPFAAGNPRARPLPALIGAALLLSMLAWAIVLELRATGPHLVDPAEATSDAALRAGADPLVAGFFLTLDVLLAALVVGCTVLLVRRVLRNARARADGAGN